MKTVIETILMATALLLLLCACGSKDPEGTSVPGTADPAGEGTALPEGAYSETQDDITVTLSTDKLSYEAGEEVHYVLTIENARKNWTVSGKRFTYSNKGLVPASDGSMPNEFSNIRTGETVTLEGALTGGTPEAAGSTPQAGADDVTFRPYVQITYGGEEAMVRAVLNLKLVQVVQSFGENAKSPKTVTVHDPAIFRDFDGTYYVFGTHITAASSKDLFDWKQEDAMFRGSLSKDTIAQIRQWDIDKSSGEWFGYLWAPDIIYNPVMEKYCIYLSANGDDWKSNIVLLTSDAVTGPYEYAGSVVYGGFDQDTWTQTDAPQVLGTDALPERYLTNGVGNRKWGDRFPNCIDACVFFDDDGNLRMSYGSWSGGIFLLELDEETGLRDYTVSYETNKHSDAYFGSLIAGGSYASGEASYIQKIGDYYWLFISYGGLEARGGYNIRVFRSKDPKGPYIDALGNGAYYDTWSQNFNQSVGVRLFGAYKWRSMTNGQVAQGHNSAFVDEDGKAYIVFHTRTTNGSEGHYVKVHQLFVNKEGWLVAAPYLTDGETLKEDGYPVSEVAGDYEVILHRLNVDYENLGVNHTEEITLREDGTVTGAYEGSWSLESGTPYITLEIGGETYSGVALKMEIEGSSVETMVFTALGQGNQLTLWGSRSVDEE